MPAPAAPAPAPGLAAPEAVAVPDLSFDNTTANPAAPSTAAAVMETPGPAAAAAAAPQRYGREVEEGNREYKWKLLRPSASRLTHLATQLHWRLNESPRGEAVYLLGVQDDGHPEGLADADLKESVRTLRRMAHGVRARVLRVRVAPGVHGRVAEVLLRREESRCAQPTELRVAALGGVDSGKSTLVGVLTKGSLDNGHGLARMQVFRHNHEVENGRTSSVSRHIMGFRPDGSVANYRRSDDAAVPLSAEELQAASAKLVSFIDLAGDRRYLKTTLSGMVGLSPDYAMLSVAATDAAAAATPTTPMALEHLDIALALGVPLFVVVTKVDLVASPEALASTLEGISQAIAEATGGRATQVVASMADLTALHRQEQEEEEEEEDEEDPLSSSVSLSLSLSSSSSCSFQGNEDEEEQDGGLLACDGEDEEVEESSAGNSLSSSFGSFGHHPAASPSSCGSVPIFLVSNVTGDGLDPLRAHIRSLRPTRPWASARGSPTAEVHVDHSFRVEGVGRVLAGTVHRGRVAVGEQLLLGPDRVTGAFRLVAIRSIHINRVPVRSAVAGQCVSLAFKALPGHCDAEPAPPLASEGDPSSQASSSSSSTTTNTAFTSSSSSSSSDEDNEDEEGEDTEEDEEEEDECKSSSSSLPAAQPGHSSKQRRYKGTVLVSPSVRPAAVTHLDAEVVVLSDDVQGPLTAGQEAVVHVHTMRQTARVLSLSVTDSNDPGEPEAAAAGESNGSNPQATVRCRLRFLFHPEYVGAGMAIVLRRGRALAVGRVVSVGNEDSGEVAAAVEKRRPRRETI